MKPGDALTDGQWVTDVADTRCGQACYVYPAREWRWASELEPTGGSVLAIDPSTKPKEKQELIRFLLLNTDMWPVEIRALTGAPLQWIGQIARRMGKRFRAPNGSKDRKKRPPHLGHWWYGYPGKENDGNLHSQDQARQV